MRRTLVFLALLLTASGLMSCGTTYRDTFKLTIEVEVDGERKIASSVYERELYDNLGGVRDHIRGTMPVMSLGRHGDLVVSFGWNHPRPQSYNFEKLRMQRPLYVTEPVTWYFPPFDSGQKPAQAVIYPARGTHIWVPAGALLSLPVIWRPPGVTDLRHFERIWFHLLTKEIGSDVRPVRITIEPTQERLLFRIPDAPEWIQEWRQQVSEGGGTLLDGAFTDHFETELGN